MLRRKSSTFRRLHRYASHVVEADREHESVSESPSAVVVLARLRPQDLERAAHQPTQHHHRHRRHIVICARNNLLGGRGLRNPERSDSQLHQREDRHSSPRGKGASIHDVRTDRGRGSKNAPNLRTNRIDFEDKEGVKIIPKLCGRHIWNPRRKCESAFSMTCFGVKLSLSATASLPRPSLLLAVSPAMPPRMMTMRNNETPFS